MSEPAEVAAMRGTPVGRYLRTRSRIEMSLYACVSLEAVILATDYDQANASLGRVIGLVWATALALALAHWFSISMSHRIVSPTGIQLGAYAKHALEALPLLVVAAIDTVGATVGNALSLSPADDVSGAVSGADLTLTLICGTLAWAGATANGLSVGRRIWLTTLSVAVMAIVANLKILFTH